MEDLLLNNIKLLACIRPGDTICKSGKDLVVIKHDKYFTGLLRKINGESRNDTLQYVKDILRVLNENNILIPYEVKTGLENLKYTYTADIVFKLMLESLIREISAFSSTGIYTLVRKDNNEIFFTSFSN